MKTFTEAFNDNKDSIKEAFKIGKQFKQKQGADDIIDLFNKYDCDFFKQTKKELYINFSPEFMKKLSNIFDISNSEWLKFKEQLLKNITNSEVYFKINRLQNVKSGEAYEIVMNINDNEDKVLCVVDLYSNRITIVYTKYVYDDELKKIIDNMLLQIFIKLIKEKGTS